MKSEMIIDSFLKSIDITQPILKTSFEEDLEIEFKNSLQTRGETIDKEYLKTICGFANNIGGTIIFGVAPTTNEIVGIKPTFANLDNRYVSATINAGLDGSFKYRFLTQEILGKIVGFLIVEQASVKPVIMKVDSSTLKVGEIYYRYPAQTTKIQAGDLRQIIQDEIVSKVQATISNFTKIIEAGNSAAVLNTQTGIIDSGNKHPKFILDQSILDTLNFIKEGEFVETEGAPAFIIKGEVQTGSVEVVEKKVLSNLFPSDIIVDFVNGKCDNPELVLEKIITLPSPYYPIHFFRRQLNWDIKQTQEFLKSIDKKFANEPTLDKILERLDGHYDYGKNGKVRSEISELLIDGSLSDKHVDAAKKKSGISNDDQVRRSMIYNTMLIGEMITEEFINKYPDLVIGALSNISSEILVENPDYFLKLIGSLNNCNPKQKTAFKKVICFMDDILFNKD